MVKKFYRVVGASSMKLVSIDGSHVALGKGEKLGIEDKCRHDHNGDLMKWMLLLEHPNVKCRKMSK